MTVAETLKEARLKAGLTRSQLFKKYRIPVSTIISWEKGERKPPEYVVSLLLRCMEIDYLSEESESVKRPTYTLHTSWGRTLTPEQTAYVEGEIAGKRTVLVSEAEDGTGRKQYICENDGFLFELRPTKEV